MTLPFAGNRMATFPLPKFLGGGPAPAANDDPTLDDLARDVLLARAEADRSVGELKRAHETHAAAERVLADAEASFVNAVSGLGLVGYELKEIAE